MCSKRHRAVPRVTHHVFLGLEAEKRSARTHWGPTCPPPRSQRVWGARGRPGLAGDLRLRLAGRWAWGRGKVSGGAGTRHGALGTPEAFLFQGGGLPGVGEQGEGSKKRKPHGLGR